MHDGDVVGDPGHLVQVVAGHQHSGPTVGRSPQKGSDENDSGGVKRGGRFVQHQQVRFAEQSAGQAETLPVPGREGSGRAVGPAAEAEVGDAGVHRRPGSGLRQCMQQCRTAQVLGDGQLGVAERGVEHVTDPTPQVVAGLGDRAAEDGDRTPVGPQHPQQEPHQGGFPGPVQADQGVDLAGEDLKIDVIDCPLGTE